MAPRFRLDRSFAFPVGRETLWDVLGRTEDYPRWWTWLRSFDASGLEEGTVATAVARPPGPWALHFTVKVLTVVEGELLVARVGGDLAGDARLELSDGDDAESSRARLVWDLRARERLLRTLGLLTGPLLTWGQEWGVTTGVDQFRRRALS